jgi:hypothetical protein
MNRGRKVKIFLSFCLVFLVVSFSTYYTYFHDKDDRVVKEEVLGVQGDEKEIVEDLAFSEVPYIDSLPPVVGYEGVLYEYLVRVVAYGDDPEISLEYVEGPSWLSLFGEVLRGVPPLGSEGSYKIVLRVNDGYNSSVQERYIVIEENENEDI